MRIGIRDLFPAYFGTVRTTGIISIACHLLAISEVGSGGKRSVIVSGNARNENTPIY